MVPIRLQTVTPQHLGVDQSRRFSLVKLVGPSAAVCRRYEKLLPHGSKVSGSKSRPCHAGSRFLCDNIYLEEMGTYRWGKCCKTPHSLLRDLMHRLMDYRWTAHYHSCTESSTESLCYSLHGGAAVSANTVQTLVGRCT